MWKFCSYRTSPNRACRASCHTALRPNPASQDFKYARDVIRNSTPKAFRTSRYMGYFIETRMNPHTKSYPDYSVWASYSRYVFRCSGFTTVPQLFFLIFFIFIQVYFTVAILFRLIVSIWVFGSKRKQPVTEEELKDLDPKALPVYTILLPVYKRQK